MKKWLIVLLVIIFLFTPKCALADTNEIAMPDLSSIDSFLSELDQDLQTEIGDFSFSGVWHQIRSGELDFDLKSILKLFLSIFLQELSVTGVLLGKLILLAIVCVFLTNLKDAFEKSDISLLSRSIVYLLLIGIAISSFNLSMEIAQGAIESIRDFLYALLPVLMALLAAMGGAGTAAFIYSSVLFAVTVMLHLVQFFIFPLIYFSAVLALVSRISPRFQIDKLAKLFRDIALGLLSVSTTLFIAFIGLVGFAGASFDGLAIKAAKTAAGIFIPVVGRSLADAMDSVLGTALVMKNAVGVVGAIVILIICALPAIKILVQVIVYKLAAAIIQPLGENELSEALGSIGNALLMVFAVLAICGLLFFFIIAITIGIANVSMMLR